MSHTYILPRVRGDDPDIAAAWLWAGGAEGVWIRSDAIEGTFADDDAEVPDGGTWAEVIDQDWLARWREGIEPVIAGDVEIVPTWLADTTPRTARYRIVLDPDRAFGSGHHDTTAGCLEAMAGLALDGRSVLDIGTGTGVLAMAAWLGGARPVVGVDIDQGAVEVARRNAADAGMGIDVRPGSVSTDLGTFDVVLANLLTRTVIALADDLVGAVAPGGTLVVSGVGEERAPRAVAALLAAGAANVTTTVRGEWAILVATTRSTEG